MELRQLEYVVALADEQQFTRAAALCGVSQSGLSAAVRALVPHARAARAEATAARDAGVRATRELSGRLAVGAEQCLGAVDVPSLLERFHRRYPQVDITFSQSGSHDLVADVRAGRLDVAFVATTEHLSGMSVTELGRRPVVLLCPPDHRLARSRVEWADLRETDFVDFHPSWGLRSLNDATCELHGVGRHVRCAVDDVHTLLDLVHRGLGVALVPQHVAAKPQAAGLVAARLPEDDTAQWVVQVVTGSSPLAPRLLELLEVVPVRADEPAPVAG